MLAVKLMTNSENIGYKKQPHRIYGSDFDSKTPDAIEMNRLIVSVRGEATAPPIFPLTPAKRIALKSTIVKPSRVVSIRFAEPIGSVSSAKPKISSSNLPRN